MTMNAKDCAVYVRVSMKDQHLIEQFRGLRQEAERRGWRIVAVYRERESTRRERPQLERMLNAAMQRKFDAVLVWRLDRLGRSVIELVGNVERLRERGVAAVSVRDGALDTASASARLQLHMLGAVAEYEREVIRERTVEGMRRVKKDGTASGKPVGRPRADAGPITAAVAWLRQGGRQRRSLRQAAALHDVPYSTLRRYVAAVGQKGGFVRAG
jgi:DNA invertase Pin-like site-specific DNA recombinase